MNTNNEYYRCAANALDVMIQKGHDRTCVIVEALVMVQVGINSIAEEELRKLCRVLIDSKDEEKMYDHLMHYDYGKNGVRHEAELILKDLERYDRELIKSLNRSASIYRENSLNREAEELVSDMCDAMDATDNILDKHINSIKEFFKRKTPLGGDCCPIDPWMLQQMMLCDVLSGIATNIYDKNKELEPALERAPIFSYMYFGYIHNRINRIWNKILLKNKYGKPLRYNVSLILKHEDLIGKPDKEGHNNGGILCKLRDTIYSTNFLDHCLYVRDGIDYGYRFDCDSIVEGLNGDKSIKLKEDEKDLHSVCA